MEFKQISPGVYESVDKRFRVYKRRHFSFGNRWFTNELMASGHVVRDTANFATLKAAKQAIIDHFYS